MILAWWTIGDAPESKKIWYCPWCGKKHIYEKDKKRSEMELGSVL